jgi:hypothetical protein
MVQGGLFRKLRLLIGRDSSSAPDESLSPWSLLIQFLHASKSHSFASSLFLDQFVIHIFSLANVSLDTAASQLAPWIPGFLRVLGRQELLETVALTYPDTDAGLSVFINILQLVASSKSLNTEDTVCCDFSGPFIHG